MIARKPIFAVLVAASLLIAGAACDRSPSSDSATATTTGPPTKGDDSALRLLVIADATGAVIDLSAVVAGALAAARPGVVEVCDTTSNAEGAERCGRRAVDEGFDAVVGSASQFSDHYIPALEAAGIPLVGNLPTSAYDLSSPVAYPFTAGVLGVIAGSLDALAGRGATRVDVIYRDGVVAGAEPILRQLAQLVIEQRKLSITLGSFHAARTTDDVRNAVPPVGQGLGLLVLLDPPLATEALRLVAGRDDVTTALPMSVFDSRSYATAVVAAGPRTVVVHLLLPFAATGVAEVREYADGVRAADADAALSEAGLNTWSAVRFTTALMAGQARMSAPAVAARVANARVDIGVVPPFEFGTAKNVVPGLTRTFNVAALVTAFDGAAGATTADFREVLGGAG